MLFHVTVQVTLRTGISDPQGSTIERALPNLGFDGVSKVGVGKLITFDVDAADEAAARSEVEDMCKRFLSNPVIEDSSIILKEVAGA